MKCRAYTTVLVFLSIAIAPIGYANDTELTLDLSGTIEPRCELTNLEKDSASFKENTSEIIAFNLYCNLDMSMRIESLNGGLLNSKAADRLGKH